MMHPFYCFLFFFITESHYFPHFVSENFRMAWQYKPASPQAEAVANSFHFHPILEEGRKLKSTFLDSLEAKVLDAIYILPTRCLCWQHRSLKPQELDSIFHIPQLQGCKKIEEGGRRGRRAAVLLDLWVAAIVF